MSTIDPEVAGLPQNWPDEEAIGKIANSLFLQHSDLLNTQRPGQNVAVAPPTKPIAAPAAKFDPAWGESRPSATAGPRVQDSIGIPGEQELVSLLASLPAACAAIVQSADKYIPKVSGAQFYFSDAAQDPTNQHRLASTGIQVPGFDAPSFPDTPHAFTGPEQAGRGLTSPFDVNQIRRDFPALRERVNGRELVWLDNAATTQKPQTVIDRVKYFYEYENSNVHRAAHEMAARATDAYEGAREKVRAFINAGSVKECVFVRGATEAINLVAQSWGRQNVAKDDEIIVSLLEHHANIVPWQQLAAEKGARLHVIPVDDSGQLLFDDYTKLLSPRTKLVAVAHVSNALGTVTPVKQIIDAAHHAGAKVLVDGAQSVSHIPIDVQRLDADFFVFSGHKLFGPTGIGVLFGKEALLNAMPPWQGGGNMIADVTFERTIYQQAPNRFEAGTGSIAAAVGLGAAIDYLSKIDLANIAEYEHQLLGYATRLLKDLPGVRLIGTAQDKTSVLSFVLKGHTTEEVGSQLNREGIAVRSGHHCAQPILRRFGVESSVRPSLAFYNTCGDIDRMISAIARISRYSLP